MKTKVMQLRIHLARTVKLVASEGVVAKAELNRFTNTWQLLCELICTLQLMKENAIYITVMVLL